MATGFMKRISWIVVVLAGVMLAAAPAYADDSWNVTVGVNDPSKGTVKLYIRGKSEPETTSTVNVENETKVTLVATLNGDAVDDYYFANWTDEQGNVIKDETGDGAGPTYTFTVYKDCKLTANFAPKKRITITVASGTWTYDGKPHINSSVAVTSGELEMGDDLSASAKGSQTDVGTSDNVVNDGPKVMHGTTDMSCKYVITAQPGTLTVTKAPLTITAKDQNYTYNGQTQGEGDTVYEDAAEIAEKVKVEGLQGNDMLTGITLDGQGRDVGEYELVPSNAIIGKNTGNHAITYVNGTLTIGSAPAQEYMVAFVNWDGTVLQSGKVAKGQVPKFEGAEPTRPSDESYTYAFAGWEPAIAAVTGDATYTAKFTATPKAKPVYKFVTGASRHRRLPPSAPRRLRPRSCTPARHRASRARSSPRPVSRNALPT